MEGHRVAGFQRIIGASDRHRRGDWRTKAIWEEKSDVAA
jgi:hypothetical protein